MLVGYEVIIANSALCALLAISTILHPTCVQGIIVKDIINANSSN